MKVDKEKVMALMQGQEEQDRRPDSRRKWIGMFVRATACLMLIGAVMVYHSIAGSDSVSAEAIDGGGTAAYRMGQDGGKMSGIMLAGAATGSNAVQAAHGSGIVAPVSITMEQSATGDWTAGETILSTGMRLSYKVTVSNPGGGPVDVAVSDVLPDGLELVGGLPMDGALEGRELKWQFMLSGGSSAELSFTCEVTAPGKCSIVNRARAAAGGIVSDSNAVTAKIP